MIWLRCLWVNKVTAWGGVLMLAGVLLERILLVEYAGAFSICIGVTLILLGGFAFPTEEAYHATLGHVRRHGKVWAGFARAQNFLYCKRVGHQLALRDLRNGKTR